MMSVMKLLVVVIVVVVMGCGGEVMGLLTPQQNSITLTTAGYEGVSVAISDQLDQSKCQLYIDNIKEMFEATSRLLFTATGEMVYFGEVVIVVGAEWVSCAGAVPGTLESHTWESSHVRVGPSHYLFADNPWTQQPGGCGDPGDWIYLSDNFLLNLTMGTGIKGRMLAHEWAKYRWGVFEEYGHTHDHIFPPAYRDQNNTIQPNYCTDHTLTGAMSCPEGGAVSDCHFTPDSTQNTTVTSSLLAVPFIETVTNFCDSSTHNAEAPTKHNLLCDRSSVMEVILHHSDMTGNPLIFQNTTFRVVRATNNWPRRVLLVDYSALMGDAQARGRWVQLRDNVKQYIKEEAAAESYLGVVVFGWRVFETSITVLPLNVNSNREQLAEYIYVDKPSMVQGTRNLYEAIQRGVQVLGPQGGTLILITHNLEYQTPQNLVEAAANNPVWPILYPSIDTVATDAFEALANISPDTYVIKVPNDRFPDIPLFQSVETSASLYHGLLTASDSAAIQVERNTCRDFNCTMTLQMSNSTHYESEAYVKVFSSVLDMIDLRLSVTDTYGREITGIKEKSVSLYRVAKLENGNYKVSVGQNAAKMVVAELWVTPQPQDFELTVWSPKGLHTLDYSPGIAPRLLVKVTKSSSLMMLFAAITVTMKEKISTGGVAREITMNDEGIGADVTGGDGICSAFLVGFEPGMDVDMALSVTDNDGKARVVNVTQKPPTTTSGTVCCSSQLDLSNLQLQNPGQFVYKSSSVMSGRFTGEDPGVLPPGRVTDLQATRIGKSVTLNFTAPGGELDQGTADWYFVSWYAVGDTLQVSNITGEPPGSKVESTITLGECDLVYSITVVASYKGVNGSASNVVRELVPCSSGGGNGNVTTLSAGSIVGIIIGCIVGLLLIILIVYLGLNSDRLDELWIWHLLTCRCCCCCRGKKKKDDDLYTQPIQVRRSDVVRNTTTTTAPVTPIRTINDLYAVPNVQAKKDVRQMSAPDEDDGGFGERRPRQEKVVMRPLDLESVASSRSTMPINQVGLPTGTDNHAYDDGPYTVYRNAPPVPSSKANTQV